MRGVHIFVLALLIGLTPVIFGQSGTAPDPGQVLASNCFQCHNTNGNSLGRMPRLAEREAARILEDLAEFRAAPAGSNVMHVQARGYTDEQLRLIAEYFSKQLH